MLANKIPIIWKVHVISSLPVYSPHLLLVFWVRAVMIILVVVSRLGQVLGVFGHCLSCVITINGGVIIMSASWHVCLRCRSWHLTAVSQDTQDGGGHWLKPQSSLGRRSQATIIVSWFKHYQRSKNGKVRFLHLQIRSHLRYDREREVIPHVWKQCLCSSQ